MFSFIKNNYKLLGAFFFSLLTILLLVVIILLIVDGVHVSYIYDLQYNLNFPENSFGSVHANPLVVPALISAGASFLSSIFGGSSQASANATNLKIARETNAMNAYQAALNRNWQSQMNAENNAFNARMADLAWNRETAWNSAEAQMQRLQAAGINPFVAAADVAQVTGNSSVPQAQAGSSPSGATATAMPVQVQPENYLGGFASSALQFAQAFASIAEAKKAGAETSRLENLLNLEVEEKSIQNAYNKNQLELFERFGRTKYWKEILLLNNQIWETAAHTKEIQASEDSLRAAAMKYIEEGNFTHKQRDLLTRTIDFQVAQAAEAVNTQRAQTREHEAGATNAIAQARAALQNAKTAQDLAAIQRNESQSRIKVNEASIDKISREAEGLMISNGVKAETYKATIHSIKQAVARGDISTLGQVMDLLLKPISTQRDILQSVPNGVFY